VDCVHLAGRKLQADETAFKANYSVAGDSRQNDGERTTC
jgi:hypothetical protein